MAAPNQHPHLDPLPEGEEDAKRQVRVLARSGILQTVLLGWIWLFTCFACGCQAAPYYVPPLATTEMARRQDVDLAILQRGRVLFAYRCIQCHTAPSVWHYRMEDWPGIVNSMAHRASLKPAERAAIIAYVRAVRSPE